MVFEHRLLGPPGTGKTARLCKAIEAANTRYAGEILVTSFTRAAAKVLAGRTDLPQEQIGTLHAHCYRALGRPEIAEDFLDEWNQFVSGDPFYAVTPETLSAVSVEEPYRGYEEAGKVGDKLRAQAQLCRSRMLDAREWPPEVYEWYSRWRDWLDLTGRLDFTGLLERALADIPCAPGMPSILFGDEAQDWSALEYALFRKWAAAVRIGSYIAGDTAQTIYGFKGASPMHFFTPEIPEENYQYLRESYRIPRTIHAVAEQWLMRSSDTRAYKGRQFQPMNRAGYIEYARGVGAGSGVYSYKNPEEIVGRVAAVIGKTEASVMFLATCDYMLNETIRELKRLGVPFHNPYRTTHGAWNPLRGGTERLRAFLEPLRPDLFYENPQGMNQFPRLWTWQELQKWTDIIDARQLLLHGAKKAIDARVRDDNKRRIKESISDKDMALLFSRDAIKPVRECALKSDAPIYEFKKLICRSKMHLMEYAINIFEKTGARGLVDAPKVIIGTIHSVKGGEADNVIIYPDLSASAHINWISSGNDMDNIRRVFYVGLTRARNGLFLAGASGPRSIDWRE